MTSKHAIERTSPKGEGKPFIGTCMKCGRTGLSLKDADGHCDNIAGMTDEEVLLRAVDPPLKSVALRRIIEEVRDAQEIGKSALSGYNRVYHRHNR